MPDMLDLFLDSVEGYFGTYPTAEIREDVRSYLSRRIPATKAHFSSVFEALKEKQAIRFGPPDVATTKVAIEEWEKDRGRPLVHPRRQGDYVTGERPTPEESAPATREDLEEIERIIAKAATTNPVAKMLLQAVSYREPEKSKKTWRATS